MRNYKIEDVLQLFNPIIEVLKSRKKKYVNGAAEEEPAFFYEGHHEIHEQYERIKVHSEHGYFPNELFEHRSPNQTDQELSWIKENYKQITLPVWLDYQNTRGRAWHNSNWSIAYQEEDKKYDGQYFRTYVEKELPIYGSLLSFVTNIMPNIKTKDPNGVLIVKPYEYTYKIGKDKDGNDIKTLDDQTLLKPTVFYYDCDKVVMYKEDDICIVETDDRSPVEYMGKIQTKGLVFEIHTVDSIYKATQVGRYVDYTFSIELELNHNWGQMLANRLGGIPKIIKNKLFFESPFIYAVDNLDLALLDSSNLIASKAKCVYPVRVMVGSECDFVDTTGNRCNDGKIYFENGESLSEKVCPKCSGSGLKNRISPMGELLWAPDGLQDKQVSGTEILRYVSPEIHTLEFLDKQIQMYIDRAYSMLHMSTTSDKANANSQTATLTNVENKALMASIKLSADQEFDLYAWLLDAIGWLRYGDDYKQPNIIRPVTFDFTTEKDYLELLKFARESGATPVIIRQILMKYITSIYFTNKLSSDAFSLLMAVDIIIEKSNDEVDMLLAQGIIEKYNVIIHNSGINIIQNLYQSDSLFFEKTLEQQKNAVIVEAKNMVTNSPVNDILTT